jgi:hypothetical protein
MKRREFVEKVSMGSAALVAGGVLGKAATTPKTANAKTTQEGHDHTPMNGERARTVVSFGQWRTDLTPPLDRFPNVSPRTANQHKLIPFVARVTAGGAVDFVISGFHHVLIYAPGTETTDINPNLVVPATVPPLINDPTNRVYRGLDPNLFPLQERTEGVTFATPGKYLVICGVQPHFVNDNMHGFIDVRHAEDDDDDDKKGKGGSGKGK